MNSKQAKRLRAVIKRQPDNKEDLYVRAERGVIKLAPDGFRTRYLLVKEIFKKVPRNHRATYLAMLESAV